jgi:tetratricopeptide (TPR) repeat protein
MRAAAALAALLLVSLPASASEGRVAADFEIAAMEKRLRETRDPLLVVAAYLNLGDARLSRSENAAAARDYAEALSRATSERHASRRSGRLSDYASFTSYAALSAAKLGRREEAFLLLEEAARYRSGSPRHWNLYASAMLVLGESGKAVAAARNAVLQAEEAARERKSASTLLDLAVYRYSLASALASGRGGASETRQALELVLATLDSPELGRLRSEVRRREMFEAHSSVESDAATWVSLAQRARIRLARLAEAEGDRERAREIYRAVLALRSDDPVALEALARLARDGGERASLFAAAFDANPFSLELIRLYEKAPPAAAAAGRGAGSEIRAALDAERRGLHRAATAAFESLDARFPANDTVAFLLARSRARGGDAGAARAAAAKIRSPHLRLEAEAAIAGAVPPAVPDAWVNEGGGALDPSGVATLSRLLGPVTPATTRALLGGMTFRATATFDEPLAADEATTTFVSGLLGGTRFRFSAPVTFNGRFAAGQPLVLAFRPDGVTSDAAGTILLLEPLGLGGTQ